MSKKKKKYTKYKYKTSINKTTNHKKNTVNKKSIPKKTTKKITTTPIVKKEVNKTKSNIYIPDIQRKKYKKKRRLKKSVKRILFLMLILIIIDISVIISYNQKKKVTKKSTSKVKVIEKKTFKHEKTYQEKIKNYCKSINYCKTDYYKRYEAYHNINKNLNLNQVILNVNMNLDYSFYTHSKETKYLNTSYILVNKYYHLNNDYVPDNLEDIDEKYARSGMKLVKEARDAYESMASAAASENFKIIAMSSYRSYKYQVDLYNKYVKEDGVSGADKYSARAGYSEHQTGLCIDMYDGKTDYTNFSQTNSFKWMQENDYKYGFILRFPKDKENITGYEYESWHYRYVGVDIATYIHEHNITFEEYYAMFIEDKK